MIPIQSADDTDFPDFPAPHRRKSAHLRKKAHEMAWAFDICFDARRFDVAPTGLEVMMACVGYKDVAPSGARNVRGHGCDKDATPPVLLE